MKKKMVLGMLVVLVLAMLACATTGSKVEPSQQTKIALVLGAGAAKGFAHIGVIKVLEMNKVPIHMIIGTSVGSVVGSLYASGYDAFQLQQLALVIEKKDVVDLVLPDNGFIKGDKLEEFINKTLNNTAMEKLKIPFYAVATDIQSGQEIVFGRGNTGQAVRASCSIPGIFRPAKIGDRMYVDGGIVSPVAVDAAKRLGADIVIAVDISGGADRTQPASTIETIFQTYSIMYAKLASLQMSKADVVIRPKVGFISSGDFSKRHEAIIEGEKAAMEMLPDLMPIINKLKEAGKLEK